MSDEELLTGEELDETTAEDEEVEGEDGEAEDEDDGDEILDSDNATYAAPKKKKKEDVDVDDFSIASRQKAREELDEQIAAFLARGGKISTIDPNVTADPPKKPTSDYGGRPI